MLQLDNVVIRQQDFSLRANWSVNAGRKVAIIGPSGGGKSTLLAAIAGFVAVSDGRIIADSRDITALPPGARPISLLFQDHNLFAHLSLGDNVALGLSPRLKLSADQWRKVSESLATVGLEGMEARKPATLSGGQQSRAALARILLMSRPVVLMDEPFSALGPAMKAEMLDLVMKTLGQTKATLLMVTHDPNDAIRLGDQTILLDDGVANAPVDTQTLFADPPAALKAYLG
jgi:thiamine transport system ATP-binding protein